MNYSLCSLVHCFLLSRTWTSVPLLLLFVVVSRFLKTAPVELCLFFVSNWTGPVSLEASISSNTTDSSKVSTRQPAMAVLLHWLQIPTLLMGLYSGSSSGFWISGAHKTQTVVSRRMHWYFVALPHRQTFSIFSPRKDEKFMPRKNVINRPSF